MIENDTIELLKECNAGVKMGVTGIDEVFDKIKNEKFKRADLWKFGISGDFPILTLKLKERLQVSKEEHQRLGSETHELLNRYHDSGKEPNIMAKSMSWIKTNVALAMEETDHMAADLLTDGCNMGIKSLNRYLNKYEAAEEKAKDIAKRLVNIEEDLVRDIRSYL